MFRPVVLCPIDNKGPVNTANGPVAAAVAVVVAAAAENIVHQYDKRDRNARVEAAEGFAA